MNGFQEELRNRILSVASHIEIRGMPTLADDAAVAGRRWPTPREGGGAVRDGQAMLSVGEANRGAIIRGVDPAREGAVADIGAHMRAGR
jgi:lipoprotein-releasing system permease protein